MPLLGNCIHNITCVRSNDRRRFAFLHAIQGFITTQGLRVLARNVESGLGVCPGFLGRRCRRSESSVVERYVPRYAERYVYR
jgi:hypothetical protein